MRFTVQVVGRIDNQQLSNDIILIATRVHCIGNDWGHMAQNINQSFPCSGEGNADGGEPKFECVPSNVRIQLQWINQFPNDALTCSISAKSDQWDLVSSIQAFDRVMQSPFRVESRLGR